MVNAEVWTRDGRECVDLLETNLRGPFRVQGTLQVGRGEERSCEFLFFGVMCFEEPGAEGGVLSDVVKDSPRTLRLLSWWFLLLSGS